MAYWNFLAFYFFKVTTNNFWKNTVLILSETCIISDIFKGKQSFLNFPFCELSDLKERPAADYNFDVKCNSKHGL